LPLPQEILSINKEEYVAPKTNLQKDLVAIWENILNTKPIGINDNFFELGGDSLLAMNLNVELLKITNKVTYADIFRFPTIKELSGKITNSDSIEPLFNKIENLSSSLPDILNISTQKAPLTKFEPNNILLTGATGFLGIHILEQFINNVNGSIYCIVRGEPGITPITKLHQKLNYYFGNKYDDLLNKKIFAIPGNITAPGFGLNQEDLLKLANTVDAVVNSAAIVAHFGDYGKFYRTNVQSVKYMIDFCKSFNKKLYHISTLSVSGDELDKSAPKKFKKKTWFKFKKSDTVTFDESCLYIGQKLDSVYTRSKFEAEICLLEAINQGLDGYIFRMGNLMPRFQDGKFQENVLDNDFIQKVISFIKVGAIPDYIQNRPLEFTPIDVASNAIYKIITNNSKQNRIFHIHNHNIIQIKKLVAILKKSGLNIDILPEDKFKIRINSIINNEISKNMLKNLINDFDKDLHLKYNSDIIVISNFTNKYLNKSGFKWPKIQNKYLVRFVDLLKRVI